MRLVQIAGEPIELVLPETAVAGDPSVRLSHGAGDQPAAPDAAISPAEDEPGALEHAQMFGDRG